MYIIICTTKPTCKPLYVHSEYTESCATAADFSLRQNTELLSANYDYRQNTFHFWISLSLRPKTETKRLNFGLSPELRLTNHRSASSLTSSATHR